MLSCYVVLYTNVKQIMRFWAGVSYGLPAKEEALSPFQGTHTFAKVQVALKLLYTASKSSLLIAHCLTTPYQIIPAKKISCLSHQIQPSRYPMTRKKFCLAPHSKLKVSIRNSKQNCLKFASSKSTYSHQRKNHFVMRTQTIKSTTSCFH
jgi:hypothetical protein